MRKTDYMEKIRGSEFMTARKKTEYAKLEAQLEAKTRVIDQLSEKIHILEAESGKARKVGYTEAIEEWDKREHLKYEE